MGVAIGARSKEREYAYPDRRAWLAEVIADAVARGSAGDPASTVLDVASSYLAAFRPLAMPAVGHDYRLADGSLWNDGAFAVLPRAEEYADRDYRAGVMFAFDAGGGFVRDRDGRIVRDRCEVARLLRVRTGFQRFALSWLAEPVPKGRKRCAPWTIARALLFADLQPALGTRPAARRLLAWEEELGAPWRIPDAAGLVARFDAGELDAEERRTLRRAESTMIRSCRRAGVEP